MVEFDRFAWFDTNHVDLHFDLQIKVDLHWNFNWLAIHSKVSFFRSITAYVSSAKYARMEGLFVTVWQELVTARVTRWDTVAPNVCRITTEMFRSHLVYVRILKLWLNSFSIWCLISFLRFCKVVPNICPNEHIFFLPKCIFISACGCNITGYDSCSAVFNNDQSGVVIDFKCACKAGVTGRLCDTCQFGFFNISSGIGCQSCSCNFLGTVVGNTCDIVSSEVINWLNFLTSKQWLIDYFKNLMGRRLKKILGCCYAAFLSLMV